MRSFFLAPLAAVALAGSAAAGPLQADYDRAQTAFDAGRMAEARAGFAAVLPRLDANPKSAASAAVVRARLGMAANALGDHESAITLLEASVQGLPKGSDDALAARIDLARAHELALNYEEATRAYRAVLADLPAGDSLINAAVIGLARTLLFSDPVASAAFADRAIAAAKVRKIDDNYAQLLDLRGRIELNAGRPAAARIWFDNALVAAGGMGTRVNVADVRIRGDIALAAFLTGDMEATRKYLANTGAGGLAAEGFKLGADMPLPPCAPVGIVSRTDMAVIEFTIADDGRVLRVIPIYATGAVAALEFGRAVRGWSWTPEGAKRLPAFWRSSMRLELRCSNERPDAGIAFDLGPDLQAWIATHAREPMPALPASEAAALPILRAERDRRLKAFGPLSVELLPVLFALADSEVTDGPQTAAAFRDALSIAVAAGAPADLIAYLEMLTAMPEEKEWRSWSRANSRYVDNLEAIRTRIEAQGRGNSRGAALVSSRLASAHQSAGERSKAMTALRRVVAATGLPEGDLLRQRALLRLASLAAAAQRPDEAQALVAATGLSPEQCSLVADPPELLRARVGPNMFPREALEWNFEGYARLAYDIDSAGVPVTPRVIIASPPFVFNQSAVRMTQGWRYRPAAVAGQSVSCTDATKTVHFEIRRQ